MDTIRHLSVRVPWHDRAWDGHVCDRPLDNSSCLALKLVAEHRQDEVEDGIRGEAFDALPREQVPPCLKASASFLSPHPQTFQSVMAYSKWSRDHKHILPQSVHVPAWGALVIPYRWMLKESGFDIAQDLALNAHPEQEPATPEWLGNTDWVQSADNQQELLDAFAKPLIEDESLVLFYATRTPLCDDHRRVLLGAGLLRKKHGLKEYEYDQSKSGELRSIVWERPVQHSLRPGNSGEGFVDGFVMPYHAVLAEAERRPEIDPKDFVAFAPEDARTQFSYGSEHVTHGATAAALLAARDAFEKTKALLDGPWDRYIAWIDDKLSRLWKLQGPAPSLGVVLSALHDGFNGTLFALASSDELEENEDPWPAVDAILTGEHEVPAGAPKVTKLLQRRWQRLRDRPQELDYIKLLARIELTKTQAKRALEFEAQEVLANPYLLFENTRAEQEPIPFGVVERGLYPGKEVATAHPLPDSCAREFEEYDNPHRLRAACVQVLELSTATGHTLLPVDAIASATADLSAVHEIPLDEEVVDIYREDFTPVVAVIGEQGEIKLQLDRYVESRGLLEKAVCDRLASPPAVPDVDWRRLVDEKFGALKDDDLDEERARAEKATALERIAASRVATLIGPAGTGKTSVLQLLLSHPEIVGTRVRLLAPTGKARVRLGEETELGAVQTVAQFLLGLDRYNPNTGRYFVDSAAPKAEATTCVVDESSMLTEDMLAAIVDALPPNARVILVGDPYQLPPIGAGCPFVDIIEYLQRLRGGAGVGELTTPRRQEDWTGDSKQKSPTALARADVQLAAIFSGRQLPPGEDEIAVNAIEGIDDDTLKYRQWENTAELAGLIDDVLAEELEADPSELVPAFERALGASENDKGYLEFGRGSSDAAADLQILNVNRNGPGGSIHVNRGIKERLRSERLRKAVASNNVPRFKDWMRFTKPQGTDQIVYGDKVICVRNHRWRKPWFYETRQQADKEFLANGEIGMVIGQKQWGKKQPKFTHVEIVGRKDCNFSFTGSDFSEDGQPYLELAYALTVHKAQGSEFGSVLLVLPANSRLISREMLYTALTRQKRRIWILHQGPFDRFLALRQYVFSDIAARLTNLLRDPAPQKMQMPSESPSGLAAQTRGFLEERLIHRTLRGEMVSSKSELVIANILYSLEKDGCLSYQVEPQLPFDDGRGRWADFKVDANGKTWYWEHCGMLSDEHYRKRWEKKKKLYAKHGYELYSPDKLDGRLVVTEDDPQSGLDAQAIEDLARKLFVG